MGLTIYAFMCGIQIAAAGSLYSNHRRKRPHMWLYAASLLMCPQRPYIFPVMCTCAGTIVFVAVLLLVTKKQQHFSWVLTHYQVDLRAFVPKSCK